MLVSKYYIATNVASNSSLQEEKLIPVQCPIVVEIVCLIESWIIANGMVTVSFLSYLTSDNIIRDLLLNFYINRAS